MPRPNRADWQLRWQIELLKMCLLTAVAALGGIGALAFYKIGGWAMDFSVILATTAIGLSVALGVIVYLAIRKLPDE